MPGAAPIRPGRARRQSTRITPRWGAGASHPGTRLDGGLELVERGMHDASLGPPLDETWEGHHEVDRQVISDLRAVRIVGDRRELVLPVEARHEIASHQP